MLYVIALRHLTTQMPISLLNSGKCPEKTLMSRLHEIFCLVGPHQNMMTSTQTGRNFSNSRA